MDTTFLDTLPPALPWPTEQLDIWQVHLPTVRPHQGRLTGCLTPEERQRQARLVFERDRDRFGLSRGVLRHLLGAYLQQNPAELRFVYGAKGKPALAAAGCLPPLQFNLSHSRDWAVYAVSSDRPVGVDVEALRSLEHWESLAQRCLTAKEQRALPRGTAAAQAAFFQYWTAKEAFLKATGEGLGFPMSRVEVRLSPPQLEILGTDHAGPWQLHSWSPQAGYQAAAVVPGPACPVSLRQVRNL